MTDNIDTKMQHVKKIKYTSQETQTEQVSEKHIPVGLCTRSKSKESDIEIMRNSPTEARNIMETPEKVTLNDSFESSPVLDCSLIRSLKVNTRSNPSPVKTSPMIESLHKHNKEDPCATDMTDVPSYSQEIKCQDEHVTIKKRIRLSVKKKTCKPHVVINSLMERMANYVKLLDRK